MPAITRKDFEAIWERIDREAQEAKFSQMALLRLFDFFRNLDAVDREVVAGVLGDWVLNGDEAHRFDALGLISEFKIVGALPSLQAVRAQLDHAAGPSVPFDRKKIERIIDELASKK